MVKEDHNSIFIRNINRGVEKGIITITSNESRITYHCHRDYSTSFKNPEEKVKYCPL